MCSQTDNCPDIHPDPHYKVHSSTGEEDACHRGKGVAGVYGAETSDCDTPFALVNATFKWIEEHIKDQVDFVVWTGDSARHDNDEELPRTQDEVLDTNRWIASRFAEVFSDPKDPDSLAIPIIPTFGNNDILPHNILLSGPNRWLKTYTDIWSKFIPEEQRHGFERGGWYYVEVIPNKLAVFSLNTLYFFSHNAAVDGCALRSEPGYEHLEWLRIQLQFMRNRGMKAILTGHIPPARTDSKQLWDETCWQKYTLWLHQFRDVVISGLYGHMNIDHFVLHDHKEIDLALAGDGPAVGQSVRTMMDEELSIYSASDYLEELRNKWSSLPNPNLAIKDDGSENANRKKEKKGKETKKDKALKKIGGPWGERFQVTLVSPSIVPNFFPTLRIVEYNITGLDRTATWANAQAANFEDMDWLDEEYDVPEVQGQAAVDEEESIMKKKKKKHRKPKTPKNPDLIIPSPPSKSSPPGPGYSPQTLTLTGYTQYFANLTHLNNDVLVSPEDDTVEAEKWHGGKHTGKHPKHEPKPKPFQFQIEYDTFTDPVYKLKDLTVRSYLKLAHRIGQYKPLKGDELETERLLAEYKDFEEDGDWDEEDYEEDDQDYEAEKKHKKKKHRQHEKNKVWLRFIRRAFVQTLEEDELQAMGSMEDWQTWDDEDIEVDEIHDGEL